MDDGTDAGAGMAAPSGEDTSNGSSRRGEVTDTVESKPPSAAVQPFRLGNRPALTGIRAVGMSFVLIFHSNFQTLPGSWAALGVFFVLSGFLITTMLASEQQKTGAISLNHFYSRRAFRLLPPLFITVALLAAYAGVVRVFAASDRLWADIFGATFYYSDYRSAFGHESSTGFLAQCWSLAVEEQFYLIWAVLFFVALKYGTRRIAYAIVVAGIVLSVANRMWIVLHAAHWNSYVAGRVYYAFDTRADALFLGCLLGLLATGGHLGGWSPRAKRIHLWLALASFGAFVWILFNVGLAARSLPLVWLPVSEVASAIIIIYLCFNDRSMSARALGLPLLVLLGNMSYAVYLFHWPVYVAISPFTVKWPFWVYESVRVAIILGLAFASWYLVEQPLMAWRKRVFSSEGPATAKVSANVEEASAPPPPATDAAAPEERPGGARALTVAWRRGR